MKWKGADRRQTPRDYLLLAMVMTLLVFGLLMLYSASAILADKQWGDPLYFVKRQAAWAGLGICLMWFLSRFNYNRLREWVWPVFLVTLLLLVAVLFNPPVAGVRRWFRLGPVGIQPAEFAKLSVLLFLADYLDRKRSKLHSITQGALIPWLFLSLVLGLILLEPDLGTPALLFVAGLMVLFIGGAHLKYVAGACACALPILIYELLRFPYRRERLMSFMNPFQDAQGSGYQLVQSLTAVGSGGWFGKGLGNSTLKLMYLPTPHTDFIFPVIGEELGLIGSLIVLLLFTGLLLRGVRIARNAPNLFGMLLASGITFLICLQAYFNIAMSIGLLPTKGLPLPFFSHGGSSLILCLSAIGILLNIASQSEVKGAVLRRST